MQWSELKIGRSGMEQCADVALNDGAGVELGAGMKWRMGVYRNGFQRRMAFFCHSHSAHMLWLYRHTLMLPLAGWVRVKTRGY